MKDSPFLGNYMTEEELEIILSHLMDEKEKRVAISPLLLTTKRTDYMISVWKQELQS